MGDILNVTLKIECSNHRLISSSINMKVLFCLVAVLALGYAQPPPADIFDEIALMNPEYVMGQECIEIQKTCLGAATTGIQKIQCWVQFGVCFGSRLLGCYKKCVPPLQECQATAGKDWIKIFQCGAAYIKCVTQDCE